MSAKEKEKNTEGEVGSIMETKEKGQEGGGKPEAGFDPSGVQNFVPELSGVVWNKKHEIPAPAGCQTKEAREYFALLASSLMLSLGKLRVISLKTRSSRGDLADQAWSEEDPVEFLQCQLQQCDIERLKVALLFLADGWDGKSCLNPDCGKPIPASRREIIPGAVLCVPCKTQMTAEKLTVILSFGETSREVLAEVA